MDKTQTIREFIESHIIDPEFKGGIEGDIDIFGLGILDSMFALQLANFIEERFGIAVSDEDLDIQNFSSVNRIVAFVDRKKEALDG